MKKSKLGIAMTSLALLGSLSFANKITMNGTEYSKIQDALDAIKDNGSYTIELEKGEYNEVLYYKGAADIKISGKTTEKYGSDVIISETNSGDLYKQKRAASAQNGRCIFEFEGTGNLTLENLTMANKYNRKTMKGSNTQAETIGFDSTGNLAAYNCAFKSHQDTLRMTGKSWFYDCYVEGDTDFIWMEARGTVSLFENCEIKALFDEKSECIIGAPRMNFGTKSGKGLVIMNSKITRDDTPVKEGGVPQSFSLARTPWNSGYYNQVAYINCNLDRVNETLWKGTPLLANGVAKTVIGWKIDEASLKTLGVSAEGRDDVLSAKDISSEYSGRKAILNRTFDHARNGFRKDYENTWDIDAFAKKNGWNVVVDSSKDVAAGEKVVNISVYDFANDISSFKDLKGSGFVKGESVEGEVPYIVGEKDSTISIPVKSKSAITVYGLFEGKASINVGKQGESILSFNNGSKVNEIVNSYIVYEKKGTVTIKALERTRISKIVVEPDAKIAFVPVTSIKVSATDDVKEIKARAKLQMNAELNPIMATNRDYIWSVSDEKIATISEFGILTANALEEDAVVTVRATSRDSKKAYGETQIKVLKINPNEYTATWFGSIEASSSYEGVCDNENVATVGNAIPSKGTDGVWSCNTSKFNASFSDGGISYEKYSAPISGNDVVYVELPFTANKDLDIKSIAVAYGNHGTGNIAALISVIRNGKLEEVIDDSSRKCRSLKKVYDDEGLLDTIPVSAGETILIRVALYGCNGNGETDIPTGKSVTIGTVSISGLAK